MLIDDELNALLAELRPGVNVTMVYDSCHSATVSRMIAAEDPAKIRIETTKSIELRALPIDLDEVAGAGDSERRFVPFNPKKLDKALNGDQVDRPAPKGLAKETLDAVVDLVVETNRYRETGVSKSIAFFSGIYERNQALYDAVKSVVGNGEDRELECVVVALSACHDNQTTLDGTVNGFFTGNVLSTWDGGGFDGSYKQMHARLLGESTPTITPALNTYGGKRAEARLHERPFAF